MQRVLENLSFKPFFTVLVLVLLGAAVFVATGTTVHAVSCDDISYGSAIPGSYGAPYSLFYPNHRHVQVDCGAEIAVSVGSGAQNEYIYRYIYEWKDGKWLKRELSGDRKSGNDWLVGSAHLTLERSSAEMLDTNYVVAYVCTLVNGTWKCGCRDDTCARPSWQIQRFSAQALADRFDAETPYTPDAAEFWVEPPSTYNVRAGQSFTLSGHGFSTSANKIYFNDTLIASAPSANTGSISFTVPASVAPGAYTVHIHNGAKQVQMPGKITVVIPGAVPPTISRIEPAMANYGDTVTIYGSGFTKTGNTVHTTFGTFTGIDSPDGTSLQLRYEDIALFEEGNAFEITAESSRSVALPVQVLIGNTNGMMSKEKAASFTLTLKK